MKFLKWLFLGILFFVLLLAGSVAYLVTALDPNDYKPQIAEQVKKATGRDLTITGDINWSLFPWLGLELGKTSLANPPGFSSPVFAQLDRVEVHVAIMPLLQKRVETKKIIVRGVAINLEKLASGKDNWSDLAGGEKKAAEDKQESTAETTSAPQFDISVAGLELLDAKLSYVDKQAGTQLKIDPLNLRTGVLALNKPVPVDADLTLYQNDLTLALALSGSLTADIEHNHYRFADVRLTNKIAGSSVPGGSLTATSRFSVVADLDEQTLSIDPLTIKTLDATLSGKLNVNQLIDGPSFIGELRSNEVNPKQLMADLGLEPPATTDKTVLQKATMGFRIKGNAKQLSLTDLHAILDDSTLQGEVSIADLAKMALRFKLTLDQIDVDRYLPPVGAASGEDVATGKAEAGASDVIALPVELLRSLDVQGDAEVKKLIASKLLFEDATVSIKGKNGRIEIAPLAARLYKGRAEIRAGLDVTTESPKYHAEVNLGGVRSEGILETLFGDRYISGTASFKTSVKTSGNTVSALTRQLGGKFEAKFTDGTIKGSKLSRKIHEAQNAIRKFQGKPPLTEEIDADTKFSLMQISGVIQNGVISSDDLKISAPIFKAKGKGKVDLPAKTIDYTLMIAATDASEKAQNYLPIEIRGPLTEPSIKLKLDAMAKARAKAELEKKKAELKEKLEKEKAAKEAELKARAAEEKAKLEAKVKAEQERTRQKLKEKEHQLKEKLEGQLQDKLKGLFK